MDAKYELLQPEEGPAVVRPRTHTRARVGIAALALVLASVVFTLRPSLSRSAPSQCTPDVWASGRWVPRTYADPNERLRELRTVPDALAAIGFETCASDLDIAWAMGLLPDAELPRRAAMSWVWEGGCPERKFDRVELIRTLLDDGGMLIVGDSTSEQLFTSFGCFLGDNAVWIIDHVRRALRERPLTRLE